MVKQNVTIDYGGKQGLYFFIQKEIILKEFN